MCADEFVHVLRSMPFAHKTVSQIVAPPWCYSQVLLPCSPLHSNTHTNSKVNRLALPTSQMPPYNTLIPPTLALLLKDIKVWKLF
jgi:hypothetical protein